ncbi:hypothetical protein Daus18300_011388 [Diaporthe australafricana]|uniref:Uncharacterized protein n=1 Tax=Diaporthe australafricana TaxID=127596 RepID=A0ABR3W6T8_9PEZI
MSEGNPMAVFGLSCPYGGTFYICKDAKSQFLGCCTEDPCAGGTGYCPQSALRYSNYSQDSYRSIPQENCVAPRNESSWYTCSSAVPPFMGCCASNPCSNEGCPEDDLLAARLDDDPTNAAPFLTATSTSSASSSSDKGSSSLSTGAIVGISIGSALVVLIAAGVLFFYYKRREKRRRDELASKGQRNADGTPGAFIPSPYQDSMGSPSVFPGSPYNPHHHMGHNSLGISHAPGQVPYQRPPSAAPSWLSGHTQTPSEHPSVSSIGTQPWMYQPSQQYLNPVSEIDGTEASRPMSELAGSAPQSPPITAYKSGYEKVATDGDEHEWRGKK